MSDRLRWGLVGTGFWARSVHAAGLSAHPAADFHGVWGRRPEAAAALADTFGVKAYDDFDELVGAVDVLAFAVPPDVQPALATAAASAGRHVLLDKPIALSLAEADGLVDAIEAAGVASIVFLTTRFVPAVDAWVAEMQGAGEWDVLLGVGLTSALSSADSPYRHSTWRHERGALWDIGPHALATALPLLGPVERVSAHGGVRDVVHLALTHRGGATSALSLSLTMCPGAEEMRTEVFGSVGRHAMPLIDVSPADAYVIAVDRLHAAIVNERADPCDVQLGRDIVAVLEDADRQVRGS